MDAYFDSISFAAGWSWPALPTLPTPTPTPTPRAPADPVHVQATTDIYKAQEYFFDIQRRSNIKEDHNELCERALVSAESVPGLPSFHGLPNFPIAEMRERAVGCMDGTFLFLVCFEDHKDTTEVVALLKQHLAAHKWQFKQNTAFKRLSNKKIERATFQILGSSIYRREESRDDHRLSIYITKHSNYGNKWLFEFRRSARNVNSIPTELLPTRHGGGASRRDVASSYAAPSFPSSISYGYEKHDYMKFATASAQNFAQDQAVQTLRTSIADWWARADLAILEIVAPTMGAAKRAAAAVNSFLLLQSQQDSSYRNKMSKLNREKESLSSISRGVWWDLCSKNHRSCQERQRQQQQQPQTSTFDSFVSSTLESFNVPTGDLNMQMCLDGLCGSLAMENSELSLVVLESGELLDRDLCALGRWRCLQRSLVCASCSTKVIIITRQSLSSYIDTSTVTRYSMDALPYEDECERYSMNSSPVSEDTTMHDLSSSCSCSSEENPYPNQTLLGSESSYSSGELFDDEGLLTSTEYVMHPSLNGIYESFMCSRKRKYPF